MARIFISSADGVYESAGDVNSSDSGSRFKVNYKVILRHAAMFAVTAMMVGTLLPIAGGAAGAGVVKAAKSLVGKLI